MPNYLTPGVYVEEVSAGLRSIEAASSSTPVFIGTGGKAGAPIGVPTAVNNWSQFAKIFLGDGPMSPLAHAVNGFFLNTQGRCYILDVGPAGTLSGTAERPGLSVLEEIEDISIVCAPGYTDPADYEAVMAHCELMRYRVAIFDAPKVRDIMALTRVATVDAPTPDDSGKPATTPPPGDVPPARGRPAPEAAKPRPSALATLYYPNLLVKDLNTGDTVVAPASGHMAGIWARTDATRGVYKAPANEAIRGAVGVESRITPSEQGELNSAGVNVIRVFDRIGIRPWGARTLSADPEWRYLNVRRLFCNVEQSIARGTDWIVFEPNDRTLWHMVKRDVTAFLMNLWRDGALMGRTPEEAFFVKCDEETNPPESIDAGRLVIWVGMAPVKPAEFIVFQVSQFAGGATTEEVSRG